MARQKDAPAEVRRTGTGNPAHAARPAVVPMSILVASWAAAALGVRAGIDMMRADYANARYCAQAGLSMSDDPGARSVNLMFLAAIDADVGDFDGAAGYANAAGSAAEESDDSVRILYAAAHAARIHLMMGDPSTAHTELDRAVAAAGGPCWR
jgi:hypothetical protein